MFSHVVIGTNDLTRAKTFYDALFQAVGGKPGVVQSEKDRLLYMHDNALLIVTKPINGEPATAANGSTIGFAMDSPEQVEAWHAAGLKSGGVTCEDPPGLRSEYNLYLAYLHDPDGNKLCAMYRGG